MVGEIFRRFGWKDIFSMMPLFFSGLCISPNFDQNRLVLSPIVFLIFFIPAWHFFSSLNPSGKWTGQIPGIVWAAIGLFIGAKASFWFVVFMTLALVIIMAIQQMRRMEPAWRHRFGLGVISIFILYLGLNDYEPGQLIQTKVILMSLVSGFWCAYSFFYRSENFKDGSPVLKWLALLWIPALYLSIRIIFDQAAAEMFILPALAIIIFSVLRILSTGRDQRTTRILLDSVVPVLSVLTYGGFLIYFFLRNTHVLQVFG